MPADLSQRGTFGPWLRGGAGWMLKALMSAALE